VSDGAGRLTIGELARCAGVTVRTVRWYSEQGLVSPAYRTAAGYRCYDAGALARLELIRTLREIGLDLATIKRVLTREVNLADVAAAHAEALDAQIRVLRLRHAVLRVVAARGAHPEEVGFMYRLARLSAEERRRIITDFLDDVFAAGSADRDFEAGMRAAVPELPAEPSAAQVEAWVELAELTRDRGFRARVRDMAEQVARWPAGGQSPHAAIARAAEVILPEAGTALDAGLDPAGPEAAVVLDGMMAALAGLEGSSDGPAFRAGLLGRLEAVADARFERYWQLAAVIDGSPGPGTSLPRVGWVISALRAHVPPGSNEAAGEAAP
jgi:DNA-binding transcriptional MerR regulator